MVLDFKQFRDKRQKKIDYRQQLIAQIVDHHRRAGDQEVHNDLYLQHLERGFPLHVLEGIAERLSQSVG